MHIASVASLAALATASLAIVTTTAAHAQPAAVDPGGSVSAAGEAYLVPGVEVGITPGAFYGAVELDGGYHLGDTPLWLHGRFAQGNLARIEENTMSSDFT